MELDEVVEVGEDESVAIRCRRLVAAVITQGYSYMVRAGVEYGEIYTGEATIFLRIPDDPSTVYYSLSVPKGDVGPTTDWSEHGDQPNRLHRWSGSGFHPPCTSNASTRCEFDKVIAVRDVESTYYVPVLLEQRLDHFTLQNTTSGPSCKDSIANGKWL
jgi:hypothetical protein